MREFASAVFDYRPSRRFANGGAEVGEQFSDAGLGVIRLTKNTQGLDRQIPAIVSSTDELEEAAEVGLLIAVFGIDLLLDLPIDSVGQDTGDVVVGIGTGEEAGIDDDAEPG